MWVGAQNLDPGLWVGHGDQTASGWISAGVSLQENEGPSLGKLGLESRCLYLCIVVGQLAPPLPDPPVYLYSQAAPKALMGGGSTDAPKGCR